MLTTLLYIYLSGFAICETVTVVELVKNPPTRVISKGEQFAIGTVASVAWPIVGGFYLKHKLEEMK